MPHSFVLLLLFFFFYGSIFVLKINFAKYVVGFSSKRKQKHPIQVKIPLHSFLCHIEANTLLKNKKQKTINYIYNKITQF